GTFPALAAAGPVTQGFLTGTFTGLPENGPGAREENAMTATFDEAKLQEYMGGLIGHMTGAALCFSIWLGDELGLYRVMAGAGGMTAEEVAGKAGANPRLVLEWLNGQAAGGLVTYDADADRYELSAEGAMALADDTSPVFVARGMNAIA